MEANIQIHNRQFLMLAVNADDAAQKGRRYGIDIPHEHEVRCSLQ